MMARMRRPVGSPFVVAFAFAALGCNRTETYTTNVELLDIEYFGDAPGNAKQVNFELRYADCPGDNRRILRGDKELAACTKDLKEGAKVPMEIVSKYSPDREGYRSAVTKLAGCPVKWDAKEAANYEISSVCTEVQTTGAVVGVRCDRSRPKALLEKCPFLRRN
jgi:hypothetical protein